MMPIVFLAWLLVALLLFLGKKKYALIAKYYKVNKIVIGIIGGAFFLKYGFELFISIYSGYFLEQLSHLDRVNLLTHFHIIEIILGIIAILLSLCNLKRTLRENDRFQLAVVLSISLYIILNFALVGVKYTNYTTSTIPGWTTTTVFYGIDSVPIVMVFIMILNVLITQFYYAKKEETETITNHRGRLGE